MKKCVCLQRAIRMTEIVEADDHLWANYTKSRLASKGNL